MLSKLRQAILNDSGAVSVEWVTASAATIGLGLSSAVAVRSGSGDLASAIQASLTNADVAYRLVANGTFSPNLADGFYFWLNDQGTYGHWISESGILEGWTMNNPDARLDLMNTQSAIGGHWLSSELNETDQVLDLIGRPGEHLDIQQTLDLTPGATHTLSFRTGQEAYSGAAFNVYFGGELIQTVTDAPIESLRTMTFDIEGGSGDGTNILRFESIQGDSWRGAYLSDVTVS